MKPISDMSPQELSALVAYTSDSANLTIYYSDIVSITDTHVVTTTTSYRVLDETRQLLRDGKANYELYSMLNASVDVDALLSEKIENLTSDSIRQHVQPVLDTLAAVTSAIGSSSSRLSNSVDHVDSIDLDSITQATEAALSQIQSMQSKFAGVVSDLQTLYR